MLDVYVICGHDLSRSNPSRIVVKRRGSLYEVAKRRRWRMPMDTDPRAYALGTEDGEALWFFGTLATFKATAEQTGGQYALIEQVAPRGVATPLHVQSEDHESFYILEGELTFYLEDGQPMPASAGSFVHIPKGTPHAFQVDSQTARFLDLTTPQHEYFMRAAGEPAQGRVLPPAGPPDMETVEKVNAIAQEYGVEILGPPPGAQG
jgi:quercetin dioxygenase-like cupin family protein